MEKFEADLERLGKMGFCRECREKLRREYETGDPVEVREYVKRVLALLEDRKRNEE